MAWPSQASKGRSLGAIRGTLEIADISWTLGYGIRPNGEILQYNPAEVDEYIPVTRDNFAQYYNNLLERTFSRIELGSDPVQWPLQR